MFWIILFGAILASLFIYRRMIQRTAPESHLGPLSTVVDQDVGVEPSKRRIVVITGGTGFFGSACVQHFVEHSAYDEIRVVDVAKGRLIDHPKIKFIQADLLKLDNCLQVVENAEVVVHLAGIVDLRSSPYIRQLLWSVNVQGTWNMLEASIRRGVRGFVFTSSDSSLCSGKPGVNPSNEAEVLKLWEETQPHSAYGSSKKAGAQLTLSADRYGRLRTMVLLPGLILGPREPRLLAGLNDPNFVHLHSPERAGSLNVVWTRSFARAQLAAATKIVSSDTTKVAGHVFMICDVIKNVVDVEIEIRKALGLPNAKSLNSLRHGLYFISYFYNWLTNDTKNSGFLQATYASDTLMLVAATFPSTQEAQSALGWKPAPFSELLADIAAAADKKNQ